MLNKMANPSNWALLVAGTNPNKAANRDRTSMRQFFHQQGQAAWQYRYMWHWRVNIITATPSDNRSAMVHYTCFVGFDQQPCGQSAMGQHYERMLI
jgi:hypothetical protein